MICRASEATFVAPFLLDGTNRLPSLGNAYAYNGRWWRWRRAYIDNCRIVRHCNSYYSIKIKSSLFHVTDIGHQSSYSMLDLNASRKYIALLISILPSSSTSHVQSSPMNSSNKGHSDSGKGLLPVMRLHVNHFPIDFVFRIVINPRKELPNLVLKVKP